MEKYKVCMYNVHEAFRPLNDGSCKYPLVGLHKIQVFSDIDEAKKYAGENAYDFDHIIIVKETDGKIAMFEHSTSNDYDASMKEQLLLQANEWLI